MRHYPPIVRSKGCGLSRGQKVHKLYSPPCRSPVLYCGNSPLVHNPGKSGEELFTDGMKIKSLPIGHTISSGDRSPRSLGSRCRHGGTPPKERHGSNGGNYPWEGEAPAELAFQARQEPRPPRDCYPKKVGFEPCPKREGTPIVTSEGARGYALLRRGSVRGSRQGQVSVTNGNHAIARRIRADRGHQ